MSSASSRAITRRDRSTSTSDETDGVDERNAGIGIAIGLAIGTAIGVATNNVALWLAIGVAIGVALGAGLSEA